MQKPLINLKSRRTGEGGLSLLEVAIGLAIAGVLMAGVMSAYNSYKKQVVYTNTEFTRNLILNAISEFVYMNGRLPCPADPTLPRSSPNAGREYCLPTAVGNACRAYGGGAGGQVCRFDGARDTLADSNAAPDPLLYGVVPYVTLGLVLDDVVDGWKNQMSYTVTEYLTRAGTGGVNTQTYNAQFGAITMLLYVKETDTFIQAFNNETGQPASYLYAIVSHGPDGRGAYNSNGKLVAPCTGQGRDLENCNKDPAFNIVEQDGDANSFVPGPYYYDDALVMFRLNKDTDKWGAGSASGSGYIFNKNGQKVGIGTQEPTDPLHVVGDITANNYRVNSVCDANGTNCFGPEIFGGAGISCNGGLVLGIKQGQMVCQKRTYGSDYIPGTCPTGKYLAGFGADKKVICK